jgi:hypothetical protein
MPSNFPDLWHRACKEGEPDPNGAAGELMAAFGAALDVEQIEYACISRAALFLFDLSSLGFSGLDTNVVMVSHPPRDRDEAREQATLLEDYKHAINSDGFCFHILLSANLPPPNPFLPASLGAALLCGADLTRLFASEVPNAVFFEVLRRQVTLQRLCPFNTTHEARGAMFRGRRTELNRLVNDLDTHFVVSGARRIGKTTLLKRACQLLRRRGHDYRGRVFYFNCITWGNYWDCFDRLAHAIDPRRERRIEKNVRNVSYMLERASFRGSKPLLLFFDELDRVVDNDSAVGWPFFNVLAEGAAARWLRVVFTGYRSMARLVLDKDANRSASAVRADTPFLGALEPLPLQPLNRADTFALIADPFRTVEIPLRGQEQILERIWHGTAGYPFLVQFYGEQLYQRCTEKSPQEITLQDVGEVEDSHELRDYLETHFLENTLSGGRPAERERLCAFLYAHHGSAPWTKGDFWEACKDSGHPLEIDDLNEALRNLYNAKVLSFGGGRYSFTFPLLSKILREAYPRLSTLLDSIDRR